MDGLFFLLSIVGIGLVMRWLIVNDRVGPDQPTSGLFAMSDESTQRKTKPRDQRRLPPADLAPPSESARHRV